MNKERPQPFNEFEWFDKLEQLKGLGDEALRENIEITPVEDEPTPELPLAA